MKTPQLLHIIQPPSALINSSLEDGGPSPQPDFFFYPIIHSFNVDLLGTPQLF